MPIFAPFHLFDALAVSIPSDFALSATASKPCVVFLVLNSMPVISFLKRGSLKLLLKAA